MDTDEELSGLCLSSETKTNGIGETALCVVVGLLLFMFKSLIAFKTYAGISRSWISYSAKVR